DGPAVQCPRADDFEVLTALTDVHGDGHHLGSRLLGEDRDGHGGVESSGIGEYDAVGHGLLLRPKAARRERRISRCGVHRRPNRTGYAGPRSSATPLPAPRLRWDLG